MKSVRTRGKGDDDDNCDIFHQPTTHRLVNTSDEKASPSLTLPTESDCPKTTTTRSPIEDIPILPLCSEALSSVSAELESCLGYGGADYDDGDTRQCFEKDDGDATIQKNQNSLPCQLSPISSKCKRNSCESFDSKEIRDKQLFRTPTSEKNIIQPATIDGSKNASSCTNCSNNILATPISTQSQQNISEIQTPSPYLPKYIASYIRTAEKELRDSKAGQLHSKHIVASPLTPTTPYNYGIRDIQSPNRNHPNTPNSKNNYVTTSLATYIQSAEKDFDDIVKDTLTSPVRSFPIINDVMSPMNSPQVTTLAAAEFSPRESLYREEVSAEEISLQSANLFASPPSIVEEGTDRAAEEEFFLPATNDVSCESTVSEVNNEIDEDAEPSTIRRSWFCPPSTVRVICKKICFLNLAAVVMLLASGSLTYPGRPLLYPASTSHPCHHPCNIPPSKFQKLQASKAAIVFGCATTLRTTLSAPLVRLRDKMQWTLMDRPLRFFDSVATLMEGMAHHIWEDVARQRGVLRDIQDDGHLTNGPSSSRLVGNSSAVFRKPAELDLGLIVPCDSGMLRDFLLERKDAFQGDNPLSHGVSDGNASPSDHCSLRDVITHDLLIDYFKIHYGSNTSFDLATQPIVLRNVWGPESLLENYGNRDGCTSPSEESKIVDSRKKNCSIQYHRRLSLTGFMTDPQLSNFPLPNYFSDASRTGYSALVPDSTTPITISQFIQNILSGKTPNAKIGTQVIVEEFPELRSEIMPLHLAEELFWWNPRWEDAKNQAKAMLGPTIGRLLDKLPAMSYYPIFIGRTKSPGEPHPRTDLHCEPIGNQAVQLQGTRRWTLIPASFSGMLRPTVSKHGRGYFYSNLDPIAELPNRLRSLPIVYEVVTSSGDAVWIPPWVWHRVDYYDADDNSGRDDEESNNDDVNPEDSLSLGASIFHFYPGLFANNFPLFAFLIIPNLIWEALGLNIE